jgi:hypothetical protein
VDYDQDLYDDNIKLLKGSLNRIYDRSDNESFKKEINKYIKLANIDKNIAPATDSIDNVMNQYNDIMKTFETDRKTLASTI